MDAAGNRSPKTGDLELGRVIANRRRELGMRRKDLAQALDLSYPFVSQIETGYRFPSARHQRSLCKVLGLSLDELFGSRGPGGALDDEFTLEHQLHRKQRPATIDEATDRAARELEALPHSVRLEALTRVQLRIMQGMTEEATRLS